MVKLQTVRAALADLANGPPLVAVFAGGTSGIGDYTERALAKAFAKQGQKLRVYIVGRNDTAAEKIIRECKTECPGSQWRFVKANELGEMAEVDRVSEELIRMEKEEETNGHGKARLDLLYMSYCMPILNDRSTTKEGLDVLMTHLYYSRMRFILKLMPLLLAADKPAHVVSIYAGGGEGKLAPGKSPLGNPPDSEYSIHTVRKNVGYMKTFFLERLAEEHHGRLSLSHIYPGLVLTPGFYAESMPMWFKIAFRMLWPMLWLFAATPAEECGQRMLYLATDRYPAKGTVKDDKNRDIDAAMSTDGILGGGAYSVQHTDETNTMQKDYERIRKERMSEQVWKHTMEVFEKIDRENAAGR